MSTLVIISFYEHPTMLEISCNLLNKLFYVFEIIKRGIIVFCTHTVFKPQYLIEVVMKPLTLIYILAQRRIFYKMIYIYH